MSAMKEHLLEMMEVIDDAHFDFHDKESFFAGMHAIAMVLIRTANYKDENQAYLVGEILAIRDHWKQSIATK